MSKKSIKIVEKKLGHDKSWGLSYSNENYIEIDPRQSNKNYLNTLIHELLHTVLPDLSDQKVRKMTTQLCKVLWKQGYRRIYK